LADLVSYEHKRNEANGEDNRDGTDDNRSWNCGVEGPTDDPEVLALRARQQRHLLTTLPVSQGVPMLLAGDELGRTQQGNNNAYAQDDEVSWVDWDHVDEPLLDFCRRLVALRRSNPVLHRRRFLTGEHVNGSGLPDVAWFDCRGEEMTSEDWQRVTDCIVVWLNGDLAEVDHRGQPVRGTTLRLGCSAGGEALGWRRPGARCGGRWRCVRDTARREGGGGEERSQDASRRLEPRRIVLLEHAEG